jgi:hypothetical protein
MTHKHDVRSQASIQVFRLLQGCSCILLRCGVESHPKLMEKSSNLIGYHSFCAFIYTYHHMHITEIKSHT